MGDTPGDIVERLKAQLYPSIGGWLRNPDGPEAAAEIERLRERVKTLEWLVNGILPQPIPPSEDL